MTGVEILATETIYATILPEWCLIAGIILFVIFIYGLITSLSNVSPISSTIFGILLICDLFLISASQIRSETNINYIEHKVTISDEVSMNEFYEKYEILDQDGKIYTVRERE